MADTKISYQSGVIAELEVGQTATLKCKGMKMDDDVTVESLGSTGGTDERFKQLVEGTLTEINDSEVTKVKRNAFSYNSKLVSVNLPNATSVETGAFYECTSLATANLPNAISVGSTAFYNCKALAKACFPNATSVGDGLFQNCNSLEVADFSKAKSVEKSVFYSCYRLKAVILRTDAICPLKNTNAFQYCHHFLGTVNSTHNPEGLKDGYIYVPRKWLSDDDETMDYRRATNWTTLATQFRALEDYTVDGTTTGELDWEKVNAA